MGVSCLKVRLPSKSLQRDADAHRSPISPALSRIFLTYSIAALLVGACLAVVLLRIVLPQQPERILGALGVAGIALVAWLIHEPGAFAMRHELSGGERLGAVTVIATFTGGVLSPVIIAYPVIILLIGWLISPWFASLAAGLTVVATVGFVLADHWGLLTLAYAIPAVLHGVDQIIVYIMAGLIATFVVRIYQRST